MSSTGYRAVLRRAMYSGGRPNSQPLLKVLFCGEEFSKGFEFSKAALQSSPEIEVTRCPRSQLDQHLRTADVAVPLMTRFEAHHMDKAPDLRLILQFGVGLEGIDVAAATERGIWVSNIPSNTCANALSCAEMAVYLILALLKQASMMQHSIQTRQLGVPMGQTVQGKRILVVGFGNIARELVPRLKPFGAELRAVRRSPWDGSHPAEDLLDHRGTWGDLGSLAADADILILTCAQNELTREMVNASLLAQCRRGVLIINVARGGLLHYDAVAEALASGHIGGLGLDVQWTEPWDPEDPISKHPNVLLTPHVAGVTEQSYRGMGDIIAREVRRMMQGLPPTVQVNVPVMNPARSLGV